MDFTQLEYFREVARWQNVTKAANVLFVSQPTLSQSIARLEYSLGVELFDRKKGKLYLNDAGKLFLSYVESAFNELNSGYAALEVYKHNQQNWIRIASSVVDIVKSIVLAYREVVPDIHIDHSLVPDQEIMNLLMNGKVNFAITPTQIDDPHIKTIPLYLDEVFALVGHGHPLANRTSVTLDELRNYALVCHSCDSDISYLETLFHTEYFNLNILASSSESHIPRDLTRSGQCVGFQPARMAVHHMKHPENGLIPIRITPTCTRTTCISTQASRQLSPHEEKFLQFVQDFCAKDSAEAEAYIKGHYCH